MIRIITSFVFSLAFLSCGTSVPQFDSQSAFKHLIEQCDFGPRNPGSKGHEDTKNYILDIQNKLIIQQKNKEIHKRFSEV